MKVKPAFCMGKLRVKWLKTAAFPWHIPVLLTIGSASPGKRILVWYKLTTIVAVQISLKITVKS